MNATAIALSLALTSAALSAQSTYPQGVTEHSPASASAHSPDYLFGMVLSDLPGMFEISTTANLYALNELAISFPRTPRFFREVEDGEFSTPDLSQLGTASGRAAFWADLESNDYSEPWADFGALLLGTAARDYQIAWNGTDLNNDGLFVVPSVVMPVLMPSDTNPGIHSVTLLPWIPPGLDGLVVYVQAVAVDNVSTRQCLAEQVVVDDEGQPTLVCTQEDLRFRQWFHISNTIRLDFGVTPF